ncbi:MAG: cysteine desulfurase [Myxococcota bacterium]|jgi:cysteine desulfurase
MNAPIYLDHNATTPLHPAVLDAMTVSLRDHWGNPSSGHIHGRRAKAAMEQARAEVAELIGARPGEIIFTSGGTESSNLAIRGAAALRTGALVTSAIEHPATMRPLQGLTGRTVVILPVDGEGRVAEDAPLPEAVALLTVMHANNEVGTLQPIAALAARCGGLVHTDAAQSLGKVPVDVSALGVDLLTIAGHKLYAPKGVGALYIRDGLDLPPLLLGAGHERGVRPGTENVASIVGLGVACRLAGAGLAEESARLTELRRRLWARLSAGVSGLQRASPAEGVLPNTLNVLFPGVSGSAVLAGAPQVAASTGSACHEHGESPSGVLLAMGLPPALALGAVRLSLGHATTEASIDTAAAALIAAWVRAAR